MTHETLKPTPRLAPNDAATGPTWRELSQSRRGGGGLSLRGRLLVYFTILVFTSVGASVWLLTVRNQRAGVQMMTEMAQAIAQSLASAASGLDGEGLRTLAEGQVADGQLLAVSFVDERGAPVARATRDGLDASTLDATRAADHAPAVSERFDLATLVGGPGPTITVARAIADARGPGASPPAARRVLVSVSTRWVDRGTRATVELVVLVGTGVTLSAALLSWVVLRRAARPLKELVRSVRAVINGDLAAVVEINENDQIAELATAFNELLSWVRQHRDELATANAELAALIAALEQKVADRTAQFESANARLSAEIAEKEDFLRAVSHDLNAPLRNIGGMVTMLMSKNRDALPAEVVARLERIQKNVDAETDLINELLELSRIKTRRQSLALVDVEALVWELRGMFENDLKTRGIEVILETSLPTLYAERARLRQVFQNLIDNAIKYMGDGPVRQVRIGCRVSVGEAAFYVSDTGLGIHPEDLDKVFFVFRRGRGEVAARVPGKGVGLASVKSIVETYAGQIGVESTLGAGTTFRFTINGKYVPSVAGGAPAELTGDATRPMPSLASPSGGSGQRAA